MVFGFRDAGRRKRDSKKAFRSAEICEQRMLLSADGAAASLNDAGLQDESSPEKFSGEEGDGDAAPELAICHMFVDLSDFDHADNTGDETLSEIDESDLMFHTMILQDGGEDGVEDFNWNWHGDFEDGWEPLVQDADLEDNFDDEEWFRITGEFDDATFEEWGDPSDEDFWIDHEDWLTSWVPDCDIPEEFCDEWFACCGEDFDFEGDEEWYLDDEYYVELEDWVDWDYDEFGSVDDGELEFLKDGDYEDGGFASVTGWYRGGENHRNLLPEMRGSVGESPSDEVFMTAVPIRFEASGNASGGFPAVVGPVQVGESRVVADVVITAGLNNSFGTSVFTTLSVPVLNDDEDRLFLTSNSVSDTAGLVTMAGGTVASVGSVIEQPVRSSLQSELTGLESGVGRLSSESSTEFQTLGPLLGGDEEEKPVQNVPRIQDEQSVYSDESVSVSDRSGDGPQVIVSRVAVRAVARVRGRDAACIDQFMMEFADAGYSG